MGSTIVLITGKHKNWTLPCASLMECIDANPWNRLCNNKGADPCLGIMLCHYSQQISRKGQSCNVRDRSSRHQRNSLDSPARRHRGEIDRRSRSAYIAIIWTTGCSGEQHGSWQHGHFGHQGSIPTLDVSSSRVSYLKS